MCMLVTVKKKRENKLWKKVIKTKERKRKKWDKKKKIMKQREPETKKEKKKLANKNVMGILGRSC